MRNHRNFRAPDKQGIRYLEEPCYCPAIEAYQREANAQAGTDPKRYLEMRVKLQIAVCQAPLLRGTGHSLGALRDESVELLLYGDGAWVATCFRLAIR